MAYEFIILLIVIFALIYSLTSCCRWICKKINEEEPVTDKTPFIRREVYVICIDETPSNQNAQQRQQAGNTARANEIPKEYSNIKPEETVEGWKQGSHASEIPPDARVPQNAQPPTILEDD